MTLRSRKQGGFISENIIKRTKRKSPKNQNGITKNKKKRRVHQVKVLEHPEITRALRTGYPHIKPVPPADPATTVTDDEFEKILSTRLAKEAKQNA